MADEQPAVERYRRLRDALAAPDEAMLGNEGGHLSYEQFEGLVDNRIDDVDREIATVHLEVCRECAEELAGLRALAAAPPLPAPRSARTTWLALAAAAVVVIAGTWVLFGPGRTMWQDVTPPASTAATRSVEATRPATVLSIKDGTSEITLDDRGQVAGLGALSGTPAGNAVTAALTSRHLNIAPALEGLSGKTGVLMGSGGDGLPFALTSPLGIVVQNDRPTLRWQPLAGATTYIARLYDTQYKGEVAHSAAQTATEWTVTASLARDATYVWQVAAMKDGREIKSPAPPAPEARFKVLARDQSIEIDRVVKAFPGSHFVLGTLYANAGLVAEAQQEFRLVLAANPDNRLARDFLRDVTIARTGR